MTKPTIPLTMHLPPPSHELCYEINIMFANLLQCMTLNTIHSPQHKYIVHKIIANCVLCCELCIVLQTMYCIKGHALLKRTVS